MIRNIFIGILLAAFSGFLIFGAVNRSQARSGSESIVTAGITTQGQQIRASEDTHMENALLADGNRFGIEEDGQSGVAGNGQGNGVDGQPQPQAAGVENWTQVEGTVRVVTATGVAIMTPDGREIEIGGSAWRYAQGLGFSLQAGEVVVLSGFDDGDHFEVGQIIRQEQQETIRLRNELGQPLWSGRGRSTQK